MTVKKIITFFSDYGTNGLSFISPVPFKFLAGKNLPAFGIETTPYPARP
jgi:hypothetical protein